MIPAGQGRAVELGPEYWEANWARVTLPRERHPRKDGELDHHFRRVLPREDLSFVEIGCAPGAWMAYFARQFGYRVSGIEYLESACAKTRENLRLLAIPGTVIHADFFAAALPPQDVVFSYGFVEHFRDLDGVVRRIVDLARPGGLVITHVPSLSGVNWWTSRTFRPAVAAGHFPLTKARIVATHEAAGLRTLVARYAGAFQLAPPLDKTAFSREHPRAAWLVNLPFRSWNKAVRIAFSRLRRYPEFAPVHTGLLYIGQRSEPV